MKRSVRHLPTLVPWLSLLVASSLAHGAGHKDEFKNPPGSARPGVYWYFMDGSSSDAAATIYNPSYQHPADAS